ncbi:MAG: EAL domain-containing protein [Pseudomonadota bacterium]
MVGNPPAKNPVTNTVILVASDSENTAKRIESHMRNAGHPVRVAWATTIEEIEDALSEGFFDLLLCAQGLQHAPLPDVVGLCSKLNPDLPVLLLADQYSDNATLQALASGARDQVSYEDERHMRHLELICLRELSNHHNLRELKTSRARLQDFESRHNELLASSVDAVAQIQEGILATVNPAFAQLLGYASEEDLISLPLMDLVSPESQAKIKEHLKLLNKGKAKKGPVEFNLLKEGGAKAPVVAQIEQNQINGETFIELTIRPERRAKPNGSGGDATSGRFAFLDALGEKLTAPHAQCSAAVFIAVDAHDSFEERLGFHDAEEAFAHLTQWTRTRLTPQDQLFRASTGELALLVERNDLAELEKFCDSYCRECRQQIFATKNHEAQITVSIAAHPYNETEQALNIANETARAVRKLVASGGKQHLIIGATAQNSVEVRAESDKAEKIKKALEENRMRLSYQSIASLEGDTRQHYDVLLRMLDESGNEITAGDFIHSAEKFGLMRDLDRWVINRVLKLIEKRKSADVGSSVFVKVSEETLKEPEVFIAWLTEAIKSRPLKADELVFEFQELRLQNHIRKAKSLTKSLREMGAYIAIEHFGVGTGSLQMLEHIPANYVKFHPDFTRNFNDKEQFKKMSQLMEAAKQRSMKTIVSHVEDANVMARLWQMGVNYIQGFQVQEPEVVQLTADPRS